eukprot:UC4_evm1s687
MSTNVKARKSLIQRQKSYDSDANISNHKETKNDVEIASNENTTNGAKDNGNQNNNSTSEKDMNISLESKLQGLNLTDDTSQDHVFYEHVIEHHFAGKHKRVIDHKTTAKLFRRAVSFIGLERKGIQRFSFTSEGKKQQSIGDRSSIGDKNAEPPKLPERIEGVSVEFLKEFLEEFKGFFLVKGIEDSELHEVTTAQCNHYFIKRLGKGPYQTEIGYGSKEGYVKDATVFVSHAWSYSIIEVLEILIEYGEENPGTYYWFDILGVDQNQEMNMPPEWWETTFKATVGQIGSTLLILSPWNNPRPMTRAWCLFEILATLHTGADMEILLPHSQRDALKAAVLKDFEAVTAALSSVDAEKATAYFVQDRDKIFRAIRETQGGFYDLNSRVIKLLREWVLSEAKQFVEKDVSTLKNNDEKNQYAKLCSQVAKVLLDYGSHADALEMQRKSLDIISEAYGEESSDVAASYCSIGDSLRFLFRLEESETAHLKALQIRQKIHGENHQDTAWSYGCMARLCDFMGKFDDALNYHIRGLEIRKILLGEEDKATAWSYGCVGDAYTKTGDWESALGFHQKALSIKEKILGRNHPDVAVSLVHMGQAFSKKGDQIKAIRLFEKAISIETEVHGESHPRVAFDEECLGKAYLLNHDITHALHAHLVALDISRRCNGEKHPHTARKCINVGDVIFSKLTKETGGPLRPEEHEAHKQPFDYYNKAMVILENTHPNHPIVQESANHIKKKLEQCNMSFEKLENFAWDGLLRLQDR